MCFAKSLCIIYLVVIDVLQAVDIRQIYDKFPEKKGGLKELYDKGPQSAFFLVKFWVCAKKNSITKFLNLIDKKIAFVKIVLLCHKLISNVFITE